MGRVFSLLILGVFFTFSLLSLVFSQGQSENLTITTYYPSPYGSYSELASYKMKIGQHYSDSSTTVNDNNLIVEGNVGIGTTNPVAKLEVAGQVKITGGSAGAGKVLTSDAQGLARWESLPPPTLPAGSWCGLARKANWPLPGNDFYCQGRSVQSGCPAGYTQSGWIYLYNMYIMTCVKN